MDRDEQVIRRIYAAFNDRDVDGVFAHLADDVAWANAMEGTHVHGKDAVRAYWAHQWSILDPHVEPRAIARDADGTLVVDVHQVVRDLEGRTLVDEAVRHAFRLEGGLVRRFDVRGDTQLGGLHPAG